METCRNNKHEEITGKEIYSALVHLIIHAESITWNRFYNYLMGNSILVLAWTMVFASKVESVWVSFVMVLICVLPSVD